MEPNTVVLMLRMNHQHVHIMMAASFGCRAEPNTVVMHIRMLDKTAQLQQEAVGVLGINLIHAAFNKGANTAAIIGSLLDELSRARVEVT